MLQRMSRMIRNHSLFAEICKEQDTAARVRKVRARETVRMLLELVQDVSKPRVS